jgi:hypothetical protein
MYIFVQPINISKDVNLALEDLLHQNLFSNPLIQKYVTNIEKTKSNPWIMCLSSSIVKYILAKFGTGERPFSSMDMKPFVQNLSLFFNMCPGILMMLLKLEN